MPKLLKIPIFNRQNQVLAFSVQPICEVSRDKSPKGAIAGEAVITHDLLPRIMADGIHNDATVSEFNRQVGISKED